MFSNEINEIEGTRAKAANTFGNAAWRNLAHNSEHTLRPPPPTVLLIIVWLLTVVASCSWIDGALMVNTISETNNKILSHVRDIKLSYARKSIWLRELEAFKSAVIAGL